MNALMEFAIILGISLVGEVLNRLLPLPIPASIYGLVIMLVLLMSGVLKLEKVQRAGNFLLKIMPVLFVPAAVGLMTIVPEMGAQLLPIALLIVLTTVIVMVVTGLSAQGIIRKCGKSGEAEEEAHE